ncbi:MAG: electron transfer flavoprotein subunit beta/FixA family protein [Flavobacteriales bacterium]|nr:electron transfer flavoprotein subunit beta/FixA family protein [Flavobacteriales bacterium]
MKILVCVSAVPDTTTKITFTENNTKFNSSGVQFIINPYDELALTRALELTEQQGGEVHIITVGDASVEPIMRKALAIGAASAIRVDAQANDGMEVAMEIAAYAGDKGYDLIMAGRESIDFNGGQVGPILSELLGYALVNIATKVDIENGRVLATRDIDGGREKVSCTMPCVVTAQKDLCEPRIPNMRGIMQARTKPLQVIPATVSSGSTAYASFELPEAKGAVKLIDAAEAGKLIDLLREEKKLI